MRHKLFTSYASCYSMLLSLARSKMADVDVDSFNSVSAIALTAVVGAVILLLIFLCNFVKKGFEKREADTPGTPLTLTPQTVTSHPRARKQHANYC